MERPSLKYNVNVKMLETFNYWNVLATQNAICWTDSIQVASFEIYSSSNDKIALCSAVLEQ